MDQINPFPRGEYFTVLRLPESWAIVTCNKDGSVPLNSRIICEFDKGTDPKPAEAMVALANLAIDKAKVS